VPNIFSTSDDICVVGKKKKDRQYNGKKGQKDKQWSTKYFMENKRLSNTNHSKRMGCTQVLWKGKQFLHH
jgi:hypothetical protein